MRRSITPISLLFLNLLITGVWYVALSIWAKISLPCIHPLASAMLMALGVTFALNIPLILSLRKGWLMRSRISLSVLATLGLLVFWLGSYPYSPLGFSKGSYQFFHGFLITRHGQTNVPLDSGQILVLRAGAPAGITVLTDAPAGSRCRWSSINGGAWDQPDSCDTTYAAPVLADYDILTVRIESSCKLPLVRGQLKVSILP